MVDEFGGTVTVVTGGAGGVGTGVTESLASRGGRVAVIDRVEPADSQAELAVCCDAADPDAMRRAFGTILERLGRADYLVCAAGVDSRAHLVDLQPTEWRRVVDASLTSSYLAMRAVLPSMLERASGSIVAFSSGWATKGCCGGAHLAAAKAGVEALVKSVALEAAARGVRVNALAPGPVRTAMTTTAPGFVEQERAALVPMGRIGEVDDLVGPVLFLLSGASRYVTGQVLHVNGGMLMP